ncbi:MAG: hypothetical protein ACLR56_12955 [Oscillospiraceae bacterium]
MVPKGREHAAYPGSAGLIYLLLFFGLLTVAEPDLQVLAATVPHINSAVRL